MTDDKVLNATIIERRGVTEQLAIIKVQPDAGEAPEFEAGQFVNLALPAKANPDSPMAARRRGPRLVRRSYSIASSPGVRDHVELFLVLVERGRLTPRLWDVPEGGRVWMDDKCAGEFTLDCVAPGSGKDLVMVATGTGIAPYISMLRQYQNANRWRRFVVIHGVRYAADLGYHDELGKAAQQVEGVSYIPTASREPEGSAWVGRRGRVQTILEPDAFRNLAGFELDPAAAHVFLCGNPAMIDDVQKRLEPRGFAADQRDKPGNIHFERYW